MRTNNHSQARDRHWICAQRLRERRHELGLTQIDVVTALHDHGIPLTNRTLSAMEHGHALDLGWLPDLANALRCTTTYLLGLTGNPTQWQPDALILPTSLDHAEDGDHRGWILGPDVPDRRSTTS